MTALIFRPGQSSRPFELVLLDDGSGVPDVTSGDGVYSATFSDFAAVPGFYGVQVNADDNGGLARTVKKEIGSSGKIAIWLLLQYACLLKSSSQVLM